MPIIPSSEDCQVDITEQMTTEGREELLNNLARGMNPTGSKIFTLNCSKRIEGEICPGLGLIAITKKDGIISDVNGYGLGCPLRESEG